MTKTNKGPLEGLKVLDLTQYLSGPFATLILADLGAEVIKVERPNAPQGSGPFLKGERLYDLSVNRSKKSLTLNLKSKEGKDVFLELVKKVDVVVENFKPGTMERLGLNYEELEKINPGIIYLAISGFGQTGPYRERGAMDMVIQGMSGLMSLTGEPDGRPVKAGTSISDVTAGLYGFGAITTALYYREKTGKGQFIDVGMLDSTFSVLENAVINTLTFNENPERRGNMHPTSVPFQTFETSDGDVIITCSRDPVFYRLCDAMDRPDIKENEKFSTSEARRLNQDELVEEITKFTKAHTLDECVEILDKHDVPNGRINTVKDACKDPQILSREMIVEVDHPIAGKYQMAGNPLNFSLTDNKEYRPAPIAGEHNREVLSELLNLSDEEIDEIIEAQTK